MGLSELLDKKCILFPFEARDKWEAIRMLTTVLVESGCVDPSKFDEIHNAVVHREKELSTGMEKGIAIPHATVDIPGEAVAAMGIAPQGIPFECLDGAPSRIIVLLITPKDKKLKHLRTLSTIVKILSDEGLRTRLLESKDKEEIMEILQAREKELSKEGEIWPGPLSSSS